MAYADAPSRKIQEPLSERTGKRPSPRKPKPQPRGEAALWSASLFDGIAIRRQRAIVRAAATRLGEAIRAGVLDPPRKPEPVEIDPALQAIEHSPPVRQAVGRLDVSGESDAAAWAEIQQGPRGREVHVFYRYGREVLATLALAVEVALAAAGVAIRAIWKRIDRARHHGPTAWVAVFPLAAAAAAAASAGPASPPPKKRSKKRRRLKVVATTLRPEPTPERRAARRFPDQLAVAA